MSAIHIKAEDGSHPVYTEEQIRVMLAEGTLVPETPYWREGMTEWRPLQELFPLAIIPDTPALHPELLAPPDEPRRRRTSSRRYRFKTDPAPLTVFLQCFYIFSLGLTVFFVEQSLDKIYGWSKPSAPNSLAEILGNGQVGATGGGLTEADAAYLFYFLVAALGVQALAEILLYFWVYFTNRNSRGFASNMTYCSGWAVSGFLIPILNFFRPYQVMQEIWKVSAHPSTWNGRPDSIFVGFWFALRFFPFLLIAHGPFHTPYSNSDDPHIQMIGTAVYWSTLEFSILISQIVTLGLVSVITSRQIKIVRRSAAA